jgi:hypothetical protein
MSLDWSEEDACTGSFPPSLESLKKMLACFCHSGTGVFLGLRDLPIFVFRPASLQRPG